MTGPQEQKSLWYSSSSLTAIIPSPLSIGGPYIPEDDAIYFKPETCDFPGGHA